MSESGKHSHSAAERLGAAPEIDDCWNRIGVAGDASCPRLSEHIHCRNCPVYAEASRRLLDRMPVDWSSQGQTANARESVSGIRDHGKDAYAAGSTNPVIQVLVFRLASEWLALPVSGIEEVAPVRPIHSLPHRRGNALLGIVNIRGALLSCVSLKTLLNIEMTAPSAAATARMVIVTTREGSIATVVDEIDGIHGLDPASLSGVPATLAHASVKHATGWGPCGKHNVGFLDIGAIRSAMQRGMQ